MLTPIGITLVLERECKNSTDGASLLVGSPASRHYLYVSVYFMFCAVIHTRINSLLQVIFHESDDAFSPAEAVNALIRAEHLGHGRCAVVWDLRKSAATCFNDELGMAVKAAVTSHEIKISAHARAIVVGDGESADQIRHLVKDLGLPGPWIVMTNIGEAVSWVGHQQRQL